MQLSTTQMLRRLGSGEPIDTVRGDAGLTRDQFEAWWRDEAASRVPDLSRGRTAGVDADMDLLRDRWGVPHVFAGGERDLFFGFGYAMAQDRLWQLDYYRRKSVGRLAEVLGEDALNVDVLVRTVGLNRIAAAQLDKLPSRTIERLDAFSAGINAVMEESRGCLPIEFDLLGYSPEPWSPLDSVAVWTEFRWYLTGRLGVIYTPELARRTLGDGELLKAHLTPEAGDESILPPGSYPSSPNGVDTVGEVFGSPDDWIGSNNWVAGGSRTASGKPIVASDPHIAIGSLSCWYQVHLSGGPFNVVGTAYVGTPVIVFGRNERVAWGLTNNICSQRDLYREKTDAAHPGHFLYDGAWEPSTELTETIAVKDADDVARTVRFSRNGPIVDELVPALARDDGPVSLKWLGQTFSDEISCSHDSYLARSCDEFREALRGWIVPTLSFGFADVDGHIGYQCVGRIPLRKRWERGLRKGWDPDDQWQGLVPYDGMPALADPPQDWVRSANNRTAPEDYPYPLSGTWPSGHRALRIRQMLQDAHGLAREDLATMQMDSLVPAAADAVHRLLKLLSGVADPRVRQALSYLESWDGRAETDRVGASIWELFSPAWSKAVSDQRFQGEYREYLSAAGGLAVELLSEDSHGWMTHGSREEAALAAMGQALDRLAELLGPDMSGWAWGKLHRVRTKHLLTGRGDLAQLLDREGGPVAGGGGTVLSAGWDAEFKTVGGSNYRLTADMADSPPGLWAHDVSGTSGHPGSPNYCDQLDDWAAGIQHYLPMDRDRAEAASVNRQRLTPKQR